MKILMIHHRIPYPLTSGMDKLRYNLIRSLSTEHEVTLVAPVDEFTEESSIENVRNICHRLITVPVKNRANEIQDSGIQYLKRLIRLGLFRVPMYITNYEYPEVAQSVARLSSTGEYDIVQVTSNITAEYLDYAKKLRPHILGPTDDAIEGTRSNMAVADHHGKLVHLMWWLRYRASLHHDIKACRKSDWVFFHSEEDLERVSTIAGGLPRARVLPVAVEVDDKPRPSLESPQEIQEPDSIIFVGGFGSYFNQDAVLFFYKYIFPTILNSIPSVKFYVVGQHPSPDIRQLEQSGTVIVTGAVPDVRPYIEKAAVYVSPLRAGTGFKTKIVEALSLGKAIVATKKGVQGLWDLGDEVICIEEQPEAFASKVIFLLQNDMHRFNCGFKARQLYEKSYTFKSVTPHILNIYKEIEDSLQVATRKIPS